MIKKYCLFAAAALIAASNTHAASGNWTNNASGLWSVAANWDSNPTVPGTASGDVVGLNFDITGGRTITIDTTSRIVGALNIGDPNSSFFAYTLAASGGANLTFNNNGAGALLSKTATANISGVIDTISAPLVLADNLTINQTVPGSGSQSNLFNISGIISETGGAKSITKTGVGVVGLTAQNTYSGGLILNVGEIQAAADSTPNNSTPVTSGPFGTGPLTINGGTLVARQLSRNIANAVVVNGDFVLNGTDSGGNSYTLWGPMDLGGGTRTITTPNATPNPSGFINGNISNGSVIKAGAAVLQLSGINTYAGDTRIAAGTLLLSTNVNAPASTSLALKNSTLDLNATDAGTLSFSGGAQVTAAVFGGLKGSRDLILTNTSSAAVALTVGNNGQSTAYSGGMNDSGAGGSLIKVGAGALILSGANTFAGSNTISNGVLQLGDGGGTGSLSPSSSVVNYANFTVNRNNTVMQGTDFSGGDISGTGSFTQAGSGTTVFTVGNSYSGTTTVSAGKLIVVSSQIGTGPASVADGAALGLTTAGVSQWSPTTLTLGTTAGCTLEFNGLANAGTTTAPLNPGSVTRNATVTVNLNSIAGGLTVGGSGYPLLASAGASTTGYVLGAQPSGAAGHLAVSGTTLTYVVDSITSDVWNAATPGGLWDVATTADWTGHAAVNSPPNTFANGDTVLFNDSVAGPQTVTVGAPITQSQVSVINAITDYTIVSSSANNIGGSGGLNKSSAGSLTLAGPNTYTGGTTLSGGQLNINDGGALGSGLLTIAGGTLDNTGSGDVTLSQNNAQNWIGDITYAGSIHNLNLGTGAVAPTGNRQITVSANALTVGGAIGGGPVSIIKAGNGTLTLAGASTFSGGLTLNAGQLDINNGGSSAANSAVGTGPFKINAGTTIDNTSGSDVTILPAIAQTWAGSFSYVGSANSLNLGSGAVTLKGNPTVTVNANTLTVRGVVSGSTSGLTKAGVGTLVLSGANTYSGATTIANGTLVLSGTNQNTSGIELQNSAGATLTVNNPRATGSGPLTSSSVGGNDQLRTINLHINGGGTITMSNSLAGNTGVATTIDVNNNGSGVNGVIQLLGTNTSTLANGGSQTYNITGGNGYSLLIGNIQDIGGSDATFLLNPTTANLTIGNFIGANASGRNYILELSGSGSVNSVVGVIRAQSGTVAVTKSGDSTWKIVGSGSTYTGATMINQGVLQLGNGGGTGSLSPNSSIVNNATFVIARTNAVVEGTDFASITGPGAININSGELVIGPDDLGSATVSVADNARFGISANSLTNSANVGSLTLGSSGSTALDFAYLFSGNPTNAALQAASVNINGASSISINGEFSIGTFPVLKYGSLSGSFATSVIAPRGVTATLSNDATHQTLYVVVSAVVGGGIQWTGTNNVSTNLWDRNTTTNWLYNGSPTAYLEIVPPGDAVMFNDSGSGTVLLSNTVSPVSVTISNSAVNYTFQGTGQINSPVLTKVGSGTVTLNLPATFSRSTVISNGTLNVGGINETFANLSGNGALTNTGASAILTINESTNTTYSGSVGGAFNLTKIGNGVLTLSSSTNILSGSTYGVWVRAGELVLDSGMLGAQQYCDVGQSGTDVATMTLKGTAVFTNGADFNVGDVDSSSGTLNISNSASLAVNSLFVGSANGGGSQTASGTVNQAGGSVTQLSTGGGTFIVGGRNSIFATGIYNLIGGTLTVNSDLSVGGTGTGTFNQSGGTVLAQKGVIVGRTTSGQGTYNLNGGTLSTANVVSTNGFGTFNLNGGVLQAFKPTGPWIPVQSPNISVLAGGAIIDSVTNDVAVGQSLQDGGGGGGLTKLGSGTLYLDGANSYTGNTVVSNGILAGVGSIAGPVIVKSNGKIGAGDAGATVGTLSLNNNLTIQGGAVLRVSKTGGVLTSDQMVVSGAVTYGGVLVVSNITSDATPLLLGDSFTVVSAGSQSGTFSSVVGSAGPGLGFGFTNGVVTVITAVTKPAPRFTTVSLSGTTLTFAATNGMPNGQYVLLGSTNLTLPLVQWMPILTNTFDGSGNVNLSTNVVNLALPQEFYILSQ